MERFGRRLEKINERELERQREEFEARQARLKALLDSVPDLRHIL